jgi:hypothetical protein
VVLLGVSWPDDAGLGGMPPATAPATCAMTAPGWIDGNDLLSPRSGDGGNADSRS